MSNKSFSIKENPYMKDIQGGEKKVMKKILSVALSTAMAFSMFASVAFGADAEKLTPEQQFNVLKEAGIVDGFPDGLAHLDQTVTRAQLAKIIVKSMALEEVTGVATYKDKNYTAKHWAAPFIESATKAGILKGVSTNPANPLFNPTGNVTVQELAKVLVEANKLEVPTEANNTASEWAKGYVAAAVKAGYIAEGINYQANATRAQTVVAAHAIYEFNNFKVTKADVIDANNVKLTLSTGEVVEVKLEKALVPRQKTDLVYKAKDGRELKYSVTWDLKEATKVESVASSNLKQVVVTFDGEVDKVSAEDASNYTISNNKKVESASLSADGRSVTLTLEGTKLADVLNNQKEFKLSFNNVKAGSKVISVTDYKFTPLDNTLPTATAVQALGNKTVKLTFSEPIYNVNVSDFTIDGKTAVGYADVANNVVILKLYTTLENAEHTIALKNVQDYAEFKSAPQEMKFSVVEDTVAPTVASVEKATFEKVQIKFSEPVDKATVLGSNVYWLQGSVKKFADSRVVQISDDTYEFDFTNNRIQYATSLYISNVKDYSGNTIAKDTKVDVNPVVDQTRPEVVNAELDKDNKTFTIKFNKTLNGDSAKNSANYIIRDSEGNEVRKSKSAVLQSDSKSVKVTLVQALDLGKSYTLEVAGVTDNTLLKNSIIPFTKKFDVSDTSKATVSIAKDTTNNRIIVNFSKTMNVGGEGSIGLAEKYLYAKSGGSTTDWKNIPSSTRIIVGADSKSVVLEFDKDDLKVSDIANFRVQLVKDTDGNYMNNLAQDFDTISNASRPVVKAGTNVVAKDKNKIEITFDQNLLAASVTASDFSVRAGSEFIDVINATLKDNNVVVLTLNDNALNTDGTGKNSGVMPTITIKDDARTSTAAGLAIANGVITNPYKEEIPGSLTNVTKEAGKVIVTFNETLTAVASTDANTLSNIKTDLIVKDTEGKDVPFTVESVSSNKVTLNVPTLPTSGIIKVGLVDDVRFLKDFGGTNVAKYALTEFALDVNGATAAIVSGSTNADLKLSFNKVVTSVVVETAGTTAANATLDTLAANGVTANITADGAADGEKIVFTLTDEAGNKTSYTATYKNATTAWELVKN